MLTWKNSLYNKSRELQSWKNAWIKIAVIAQSHLIRRVYEHKSKLVKGFTQKYNVDSLVYYEACANIVVAIEREKQIKAWSRKKKDDLINALNPEWDDLYRSIC